MPKRAKTLSAIEVKRLGPGFHAVGGVAGLHLANGENSSSWILRVRIGSERPDLGLGPYPEVSVARAREKAAELREKARQGIDPRAERRALRAAIESERAALKVKQSRAKTFDVCAEDYLKRKTVEFKNSKHAAQWKSTLETYASPVIGNLLVDRIELDHVTEILDPIWSEKTETATRLRQRIEAVLDYAITKNYRAAPNPAAWKGNLDTVLPKPEKLKRVKHHAAIPVNDMGAFWSRLKGQDGMGAAALRFAILTACRSGEVRGARWDEIDVNAKTWTVPADRMKAAVEHVVPLSPAAIRLLESLPRTNEFVFPAIRGGMLSDGTLTAVLKRMEVEATAHGMRSTFRTWAAERTAYPREVCEQALAHTIGKVEAAYNRSDLLEKRRKMMRDWQRFIETPRPTGNVVELRR
jgi:integrase